jgi:hypothetical protein
MQYDNFISSFQIELCAHVTKSLMARPVDGQDQGEQPLTGLQNLRASKNLLTN